MQKKDLRLLVYCFLMCLFTGVTVYWLGKMRSKKTGVVDVVRLFDEYNMKKELEAKAKVKLQTIENEIDTVSNKLKMAHAMNDSQQEKRLYGSYTYLKSNMQDEYRQTNQEINTEVWKRLNPIVEEYGKKMHLHLIIGANGMGSVLYNDDYYDMTDDLIKYVNKKYEAGN